MGTLLATDAGHMGGLTGRENAALIGVLAGMSGAEARATLDDVGREARLGHSLERLVMSYSRGDKGMGRIGGGDGGR